MAFTVELPALDSSFLSSCSSEFYIRESEDARGGYRECRRWKDCNCVALIQIDSSFAIIQLLIHLLISICFVPGVMLGAGDTYSLCA